MIVSLLLLCAVAWPTAAMVRCARTYCHNSASTIKETSSPTAAAIEFQTRANILLWPVTAAFPALADVRIDKQPVLILGSIGHMASAIYMAHSSAPAAVVIRDGGAPNP